MISWRLGRSLGIDPVLPPKTCTFDCIYCQLGPTVHKVSSPAGFKPRVGVEDVLRGLEEALETLDPGLIDYITFSGCGEPTLHPGLGEMIEAVRGACPNVPIAILTNASLFWLEEPVENACKADLVVAKLDAPTDDLLRAINRPAEGMTLDRIIDGLKEARRRARGRLAIQSMFLKAHGRQLHDKAGLARMAEILRAIRPDQVQVNTPTRPPAEPYVQPLGPEELKAIADYLSSELKGVEVIYWRPPEARPARPRAPALREAIVAVLERRPCRFHELCAITGAEPLSVRAELDRLASDGLLGVKDYRGERFYMLKRA